MFTFQQRQYDDIISYYKKDYLQHKQHWQPTTPGGAPEEAQLDQDQALELNNFDIGLHSFHINEMVAFALKASFKDLC